MPTPDRTTIKAALQQFVTLLRANLTAEPPTALKPLRRVEMGDAGFQEYARPFLAVRLVRVRPVATTDGDRVFEVGVELRLVTDVTTADPHDAVLDKIGAVEDYLDGLIPAGVIDGAEGFDDRVWSVEVPKATSAARAAAATAAQTMIVKVQRGQNRQPA
jgi:hypothetical protein